MSRLTALRPASPILIGASVMLRMAMGLRQSLGIFVPALTRDIGISVGDLTIAVAIQNLAWGVLQPFLGALAARGDFRPVDGRRVRVRALRHVPFVVTTQGCAACGMQPVFLTAHLPTYLEVSGMDPMFWAAALGRIGGFNILASLFFGWAGGRFNKLLLLGATYVLRSLGFIWYFPGQAPRWFSPVSWDSCGSGSLL